MRYLWLLLYFLWTNPPELDLFEMRLYVWRAGSADTMRFDYRGRCLQESEVECVPYLMPGAPDSFWVALPCTSLPVSYGASIAGVDTAGNESMKGNVIQFETCGGIEGVQ